MEPPSREFVVRSLLGAGPTGSETGWLDLRSTSFQVTISLIPLSAAELPSEGQTATLVATVHGTSFTVPPGFFQPARTYQATITAVQAPWDVLNRAVFARGTPLHQMDCLTASFSL